jgi:membrane-associated phospholipid phosphatase
LKWRQIHLNFRQEHYHWVVFLTWGLETPRQLSRNICRILGVGLLLGAGAASAQAQVQDSVVPSISRQASPSLPNSPDDAPAFPNAPSPSPNSCDVSQLKTCVKDFFADQAGIWTSPLRLHPQDALWLLPLAGATAVSLNYDVQTLQQVSTSPSRVRLGNDLSNAGAYGVIGVAGATYLVGKLTHNETARETGVLSLEAIADSSLVTEVLKLATNRERPYVGTGQGRFWPDGTNRFTVDGSFPSEHATIVWAFSHVVADETPGHPWLHLGLYAVAAGVSAARVTSRNHFPSDVVVGSAIGYLVGGYVYRQHSNSYDNTIVKNGFTISPVYDTATRSYGMGVTIDPNALRSVSLKQLWSRTSLISGGH